MASTYSANLRLELIGTGEQQGTWGNTTNSNLGTLLEQAIGGYESITVSNVSDTTLTTANGAADQARNMTLNLVGTITATRNVICPSAEKVYIVKNATTGGFAVTFKVTGQTGVSIPNGATFILYVDGTDARQATGSVASGGTGTTTSTGTGSVVLSASPTFTGVPLSTTAAADTNTTQIATTAYVVGQASATTPVVNGVAAVGTSLRFARADHVHPTDTSRAALASPTFTGTPLSTTAAADTNTTQIATTAYVVGQASSTTPVVNGTAAVGTSLRYARADHVHPTDTTRAALASPTFTGVPLSTTAAVDTNTTQIATTAYVIGQGYLKSATASSTYAPLASPGLTGTPTAPTAAGGTNNTQIATTAFVTSAVSASGSASNQTYNSGSGNYTVPTGATFILARLWGGGGSGQNNVGAINTKGGGGGGYIERLYLASDLGGAGASVAYSVGAGGVAVAANTTAEGNPGGNSTFASGGNLITAYGGGGSGTMSGGGQTGIGAYGAGVPGTIDATLPWGGGAGTSATNAQAGLSTFGGGGGAGGASTTGTGTGGTSTNGGSGGNGGNNAGVTAQSGTAPGGGGGGGRSTATPSGAGGAGRVQVIAW